MKYKVLFPTSIIVFPSILIFSVLCYKADSQFDLGIYRLLTLQSFPRLISRNTIIVFAAAILVLFIDIYLYVRKDTVGYIYSICVVILSVLGLIICLSGVYPIVTTQRDIMHLRESIHKEKTIIHAGGALYDEDGNRYIYTNSMDAVNNAYQCDNHFIELDMIPCADGSMICSSLPEHVGMTKQEFEEATVYDLFDTMTLSDLIDFMHRNEGVYIITDTKEGNSWGCEELALNCPDLLDRFIVQIYSPDEYSFVRERGFKYIIYTLYLTEEEERKPAVLQEYVRQHDIVGITFREEWMNDETYYEPLRAIGVPLYVHTVDDTAQMLDDIAAGIDAVYTNNTDNEWIRE